MRNNGKVLVVGDAGVDIIVPFPRFSGKDHSQVLFETPCLVGGGTAANTAAALARLQISTAFLGTVGDDQYGKFIIEEFQSLGIDINPMIIDASRNTVGVFAFIDDSGERYLWGWPRTEQAFKELDPKRIPWQDVKNASWVHSSGMAMVHDTSARKSILSILKTAFENGVPTSLDLNLRVDGGPLDPSYRDAVLEAMEYCAYVLGSGQEEYSHLAPGEDWMDNARSFVTDQRTIIVRMGADGSLAMTPSETIREGAFSVTVEDTVGAGDVYNAGFIAALLTGKSLRDALLWGNGVSGWSVGKKGSRDTPNEKELELFIKKSRIQA